jgi:hypothetical protein
MTMLISAFVWLADWLIDFAVTIAVSFAIAGVFWLFILPFRYVRHRKAVRAIETRERQLERDAMAGSAVAKVGLARKSWNDPRDKLWWQW